MNSSIVLGNSFSFTEYDKITGGIISMGEMKNGVRDGSFRTYHKNGSFLGRWYSGITTVSKTVN